MSQSSTPPYFFTPDELKGLTLVGISGKVNSGKSTMARFLVQEFGFMPQSFARHLKVNGVAFEGLPIREVFGSKKSPHTRERLEKGGTEEARDVFGQDIWLKAAEANLFHDVDVGVRRFVFPDVRFPNEVEFIQALGGKVFRLHGRGDTSNTHRSNIALDDFTGFDGWLDNRPGQEQSVFYHFRAQLRDLFNRHDFPMAA